MILTMKKHAFLLLISLYTVNLVNAQHSDHHDTHEHHDHSEHADAEHASHHHKHHFAIFGGAGTNFNHHETKPAIGIDYERLLGEKFGIGAVIEMEFTEKPSYLVGIPFFYHPVKGLKLYGGPAVFSLVDHHASEPETDHTDSHHTESREIQYGGRFGMAYDFTIGKVTIGPAVNYVFSQSSALIYGINIGIGL